MIEKKTKLKYNVIFDFSDWPENLLTSKSKFCFSVIVFLFFFSEFREKTFLYQFLSLKHIEFRN